MQRHLCIKLLSKSPRNAPSSVSDAIIPKPLLSPSLSIINANRVHRQLFSQYSAVPRSQLGSSCYYNGVSVRSRNGLLLSPALTRRIFSDAVFKGKGGKMAVDFTVRTQVTRNFHSFDSHQYRGWKSIFRRVTADGVVIGLIAANAAVFILWRVASPQFMVKNFMISLDNFTSGRLHTLITSAFSHSDVWHLASNMVGLYFFGLSIGRTFGPEYLLKLYLSGALVGSIFYLGYHAFVASQPQRNSVFGMDPAKVPGLGASGAVNAILLLDIFLFPTKTLYFDFIIPVPAILLGIFLIGKDVLRMLEHDQQISGSAHLGGATVAAFAWAKLRKGRFRRF